MLSENHDTDEIHFTAPHTLSDCVQRIVGHAVLDGSILHPGVDVVAENASEGVYHFRLHPRYDRYKRRPQTMFYVEGNLRQQGVNATAVKMRVRVGWASLILSMSASILITVIVSFFAPAPIRLIVIIVPILFWIIFIPKMYSDARALSRHLYKWLDAQM